MREGTPWSASKNKVLVHMIQFPVDTADAPTSRACAAGVMDADPLVARSGLRPDGDPEPPRRARDYWAALVPETLAQDRLDAKMVNQGQGDGNTWTWCGSPANVRFFPGLPEPPERVEGACPLLVRLPVLKPKE